MTAVAAPEAALDWREGARRGARSNDYREFCKERDNEVARMIEAREVVDDLRCLLKSLHQQQAISVDAYHKTKDGLDEVTTALALGKRNTALLRNGWTP